MKPQRRQQLLGFLDRLGLDPLNAPAPDLEGTGLLPLEEALSHSSAGLARNHERLEFLGDAVLRLAAAEFLQDRHPQLPVGTCSSLRAQLVSDRWLAELAERCDLGALLHIGPMASHDKAGRATLLAECCEAVVGAIYEIWGGSDGGLNAVRRWLDPHWQRETAELLADPYRHNWKSALQEWSQGLGLGLPDYRCAERSRRHGDPQRFQCSVWLALPQPGAPLSGAATNGGDAGEPRCLGEGWGGSRREAEQQAARQALQQLDLGHSSHSQALKREAATRRL